MKLHPDFEKHFPNTEPPLFLKWLSSRMFPQIYPLGDSISSIVSLDAPRLLKPHNKNKITVILFAYISIKSHFILVSVLPNFGKLPTIMAEAINLSSANDC